MTPTTREEAAKLDGNDPLADRQSLFSLPEGVIYLDGNSLGPPTMSALTRLEQTARNEWGQDLIKSWNKAGWIDLPKTCGAKIASLIGAEADEVIVTDSVSVNIFKLTAALLAANENMVITVEEGEFPTDGYILEGLSAMTNTPLQRIAPGDATTLPATPCVLIKSLVHYKSAAIADVVSWENAAAQNGSAIIWDLSHATGVIDVDLKRDGARFAVGCGYKYLNGGPGAPAFIFVDSKDAQKLNQPLSGWMGHADPFAFGRDYAPAKGAARFAAGTPPILSMSALDAALDVFDGIDLGAVEAQAKALGDLFLTRCIALGLETTSPDIDERRGGHISLKHPNGYEIVQALIEDGVIGDFRTPDLMRFGFSPLYLRYVDVWDAAEKLADILETERWREPRFAVRAKVI